MIAIIANAAGLNMDFVGQKKCDRSARSSPVQQIVAIYQCFLLHRHWRSLVRQFVFQAGSPVLTKTSHTAYSTLAGIIQGLTEEMTRT
ncbi:unnamed protein product [Penicillium roqueforti FM164]|uniref:Uncharacterized protein n=1 Tax=Penicillium roqueforti (strain FM164) TaxID=1365484 RepID=W6QS89_PENRF|nr:unnamed protein product [Penicillium roqueforti FM164]